MSSRIQINEQRMNSFFERVMDEIHMMFHYHPLSFQSGPLTPEELAEMHQYQAEARGLFERGDSSGLEDMSHRFSPANNPKFANLRRTGK